MMQLGRSPILRRNGVAMGWVGVRPLVLALLLLGAVAPARAGTLDRVRERGTLRLGHRIDARPFSYQDESGKVAGYSVELCQKVADAVKAELGLAQLAIEQIAVSREDRFDAVEQGRIDLLCGAATATLDRMKSVSFSIPTFASGIGALMRKDASKRLRNALEGREAPFRPRWRGSLSDVLEKRVFSVVVGTTAEPWIAERREALQANSEIAKVQSYQEGIERVLARRSDALFGDRALLLDAAVRGPAADDLIVLARSFTNEPIALAFARGDEDLRLLVDRTLSRLYRTGEIRDIYASFFGEPDENAVALFRLVALPE